MIALVAGFVSVILLNAYAAMLVVLRGRRWRVPVYRPMLVNIALSLAPVLVALVLPAGLLVFAGLVGPDHDGAPPILLTGGLWAYLSITAAVWLLAFPNSAYLITELNMSHRLESAPVPLWYDIVSTLTLTMSGIANAVLGLGLIQFTALLLADADGLPFWSWVGVGIALVLAAFGIYLGRYLRLNSWDVRHPSSLVRKLTSHFRAVGVVASASGFVLTHAILLALVYVPVFVMAYSSMTT